MSVFPHKNSNNIISHTNAEISIPPTGKYPEKDSVIKEVLRLIAEGLSLPEIEKIPGMPPKYTLNEWIASNKYGISLAYTSAREARADRLASEVMEIADTVDADNPVAVQKARLQTDVRKWYLSHLLPEKYGDLQRLEISGRNGGAIGIAAVGPAAVQDAQRLREMIFGSSDSVIDVESTDDNSEAETIREGQNICNSYNIKML